MKERLVPGPSAWCRTLTIMARDGYVMVDSGGGGGLGINLSPRVVLQKEQYTVYKTYPARDCVTYTMMK